MPLYEKFYVAGDMCMYPYMHARMYEYMYICKLFATSYPRKFNDRSYYTWIFTR
jgi:hypothetical protein